jgi:hypothetical protein
MKKIFVIYPILISSLILGFGWRTGYQKQPDSHGIQPALELSQPTDIIPLDIVKEMIGQVDQSRTLTDLKRLTGVEPICINSNCYTITGRETGSEGLQWAKDYVYETLVNLHYSVEVLDWSSEGLADQNIVAHKQGLVFTNQEIYFIAHLDGLLDNNPATDANASGVVSLLELARILSNQSLSYSVVLFFSTGEEHGSLGSNSFVEDYPERLANIKYLVNVANLGYDSNNDGAMELWNGDQPVDFVQLLSDIINAYQLDLTPTIVTGCT